MPSRLVSSPLPSRFLPNLFPQLHSTPTASLAILAATLLQPSHRNRAAGFGDSPKPITIAMKRATMALAMASMLAGDLALASNDLAKDVARKIHQGENFAATVA